ncbi:rRNA maturation RNase YbeY [Patescibacteria group bacterium]|nr:rRNA maturation RNase YbeY [Patescibacteria group bacterium]
MLEIHNFTQNEIDEKFFQKIVEKALKIVDVKNDIEISLAIVGDGRIRKLNKMYRGNNRVTDILSFSDKSVLPYLAKAFPRLKRGKDLEFIQAPDGVKRLGEIIICYSRAKKQAQRVGHSLEKELTVLLIHGILHLLDYDHEKGEQEAEEMKKLEETILKKVLD